MPPLSIALTILAAALLLAFAVVFIRTDKTPPPRGNWLVYLASACVLAAAGVAVASWFV